MSGRKFGRRQADEAQQVAAGAVPAAAPPAPSASSAPETPAASRRADAGELRDRVRSLVLSRIDPAAAARLPLPRLRAEIGTLVAEIANEARLNLNEREQSELASDLLDDMIGLGPLEPLLDDETITDILVNGPDNIYVERRGKLERVSTCFRDAAHVVNIAQRIASGVGRRIDESSPMVDARLADGSRVNIVLPPLALDGAAISIRKFAKQKVTLDVMVRQQNLSEGLARVLEIAARSRLNVIIAGGTGSGKTTMLNAMSRLIDPSERIVTIEDAAELQLQQPHVVRLETRPPNIEGQGQVSQRDLLRNALRMRPDRIIVGEVRGGEAFDMLQAMNTGHDGSMSTIHANSPRDALVRLENMVLMGSLNLPVRAIRAQVVSAVDLIVQVERMRDGVRRIQQVTEVIGLEGEVVTTQDLFTYQYQGENRDGTLKGVFEPGRVRPHFARRVAYFGLEQALYDALGCGSA